VDVIKYINTHQEDKGIVYAGFPANATFIYNKLTEKQLFPTRFFIYHSSLSFEEKEKHLKEWRRTCNGVMICTSAFGMGIDVPDVKFILHDRSPFTVIDYIQESGRCQRGNEIGECVLYYKLSDITLINTITRNTTKSCQVISFCERETLCRRVGMMHYIDPFVDEETVKRNTCKNVAKQETFCDVCRTGKEFYLLKPQDVFEIIKKLVAIVEEAVIIKTEITIQDIADIYRINQVGQTKFKKHSYIKANQRDQCMLKNRDLCLTFVRRLVAFNVLEGVISEKNNMIIKVNKSMVLNIANLDFLLLRYEVEA
jgi:superfamily II DNA helicase RecQ